MRGRVDNLPIYRTKRDYDMISHMIFYGVLLVPDARPVTFLLGNTESLGTPFS